MSVAEPDQAHDVNYAGGFEDQVDDLARAVRAEQHVSNGAIGVVIILRRSGPRRGCQQGPHLRQRGGRCHRERVDGGAGRFVDFEAVRPAAQVA